MSSLNEQLAGCNLAAGPDPSHFDADSLTDIQWRADRCTPGSLLCFQRFEDSKTDNEIITRYLEHSPFGALLVNRPMQGLERLHGRPVLVAAPGAWGATLARLCDHFYPLRPDDWRIGGVTGTNGKTTTVKYLEAMLLAAKRRVLCLGTLGLSLNGKAITETGFTSPPYVELRRILHRYRDQADLLVMEISSHALDQGRVYGLTLDAAAWTNFSQDHLDYHGDEASYFTAKARILQLLGPGVPLWTTQDAVAKRLRDAVGPNTPVSVLTLGELPADAIAERPFLALRYNQENYRLATAMATALLGEEPARPWLSLRPVAGRFDCRVYQNRRIVVDFAHTPDALENILGAIRASFPEAKVAALFGCGGDRDHAKRPLMGAAVCRGADQVILTSDNPRFEDPEAIIAETLTGMGACRHRTRVVVEREQAIEALFDHLEARPMTEPWVALIAGKGHEAYIDQRGVKRPYSDLDQVERNLTRLGWVGT